MSDMISTQTEIDGLLQKRDQINNKLSALIADFVRTRINEGKTNNVEKDVDNLLKGVSIEDRVLILTKALSMLAKNSAGKSQKNSDDYSDEFDGMFSSRRKTDKRTPKNRSDLFSNRGF